MKQRNALAETLIFPLLHLPGQLLPIVGTFRLLTSSLTLVSTIYSTRVGNTMGCWCAAHSSDDELERRACLLFAASGQSSATCQTRCVCMRNVLLLTAPRPVRHRLIYLAAGEDMAMAVCELPPPASPAAHDVQEPPPVRGRGSRLKLQWFPKSFALSAPMFGGRSKVTTPVRARRYVTRSARQRVLRSSRAARHPGTAAYPLQGMARRRTCRECADAPLR